MSTFGLVLHYNNRYLLVGTTSVAQIHRQSVPLIGTLDNPSTFDSVRFSEPTNGTDFVPISFYTLRNCSSSAAFIDVEINEMVIVNFGSSTDKSKAVTELYLARNTTIIVDVITDVIPTYATNHCVAFLLVYDDFSNYINFVSNSEELENNFYHKECIVNEDSQTMNISFNTPSYYYIGVYTDIPTEATTFSLHFLGTFFQYNISNRNAGCSIDSIVAFLSCEFSPNTNSMSKETCIVGSVPPSITSLGIKGSNVNFYTAVVSATKSVIYSSLPIIIVVCIICIVSSTYCCCWCYQTKTKDRYFLH